MAVANPLLEKVEMLQNILVACATGNGDDAAGYFSLRTELLANPLAKDALPAFVRTCRDIGQFWSFIKGKFSTYRDRREFLWTEFRPLLDRLEASSSMPIGPSDAEVLKSLSPESVQLVWERCLERRHADPEGAITSARALLETVCKHILDDHGVAYDDAADLPKLYHLTSKSLNIAPSQHSEEVFKQILGGCTAVVEGLGALRNRLGDAHGRGSRPVKPASRHAQLAVNLAGSMVAFLVATWQARKASSG